MREPYYFALSINVFREFRHRYERVGTLRSSIEGASFQYDDKYLNSGNAEAISLSLPLQHEPFLDPTIPAFFEGLLPEGRMRSALAQAIRIDQGYDAGLLTRLNNESIGGLVFHQGDALSMADRFYKPLANGDLATFAASPLSTAANMGAQSRLSLAGAQTKIGLYHQGSNFQEGWFLPESSAPSNTIVKASNGAFSHQTLNEAFCLSVARHCGFDVAQVSLIRIEGAEPLLAIARFDRIDAETNVEAGRITPPVRLHQEDFCQAAGLPAFYKYEPTDGHYLELGARIIHRTSSNPFGDKMMYFNRLVFDYLIGNCDNHLKNHSMLWSEDWSSRALAPLYDVTCTTMYQPLDREMGVSLNASRRIDDVTAQDIRSAARRLGMTESLGWKQYLSLREEFRNALAFAEEELIEKGFSEVAEIARFIKVDSFPRCSL